MSKGEKQITKAKKKAKKARKKEKRKKKKFLSSYIPYMLRNHKQNNKIIISYVVPPAIYVYASHSLAPPISVCRAKAWSNDKNRAKKNDAQRACLIDVKEY